MSTPLRHPVAGRSNRRNFSPLTMQERLERFPPVVCRILARKRRPAGGISALSDAEVSAGSGLSVTEVSKIARLSTWDHVPVLTLFAFVKGCGLDLDSRDCLRTQTAYMKRLRSLPKYLLRHPDWETTFKPLLQLWVSMEDGE